MLSALGNDMHLNKDGSVGPLVSRATVAMKLFERVIFGDDGLSVHTSQVSTQINPRRLSTRGFCLAQRVHQASRAPPRRSALNACPRFITARFTRFPSLS